MTLWWALQAVVAVAAVLSEGAIRWASIAGNRGFRWLVIGAFGALFVPLPSGTLPEVERLVPAPVAFEMPAPIQAPLHLAATTAQSRAFVWVSALLTVGLLSLLALQVWRRLAMVRSARVVHRRGWVSVVVAPVATPCVFWLGRMWVVLDPVTAADAEARHLAVRHELQHIRHGDVWFAWLSVFLVALCAPNPFAWRLARNLAELDEQAVDHALVHRNRVPARAYGHLLVAAASRAPSLQIAVGLAQTTPLHRRLTMLASPRSRRPLAWLVCSFLLVGTAAWASSSTPACDGFTSDLAVPDHHVVDTAVAKLDRSRFIERALRRRPEHQQAIQTALTKAGLPLALEAVVLVESGYDDQLWIDLKGAGSGAGLWMFIPKTARQFGLRVDEEVDERLDPERETEAAMALLRTLHDRYDNWDLALAAYNQGPRHVDAAIAAEGTRDVAVLVERGALSNYVPMVWAGMRALGETCR